MLAPGAIKGRALSLPDFPDWHPAADAGLPCLSVDIQRLLEVARLTMAVDEVTQGGAALRNRVSQDFPDHLNQQGIFFSAYPACGAFRVNAGHKQGLASVYISDPDHDMTVHDELLDSNLAATRTLIQVVPGKVIAKGFMTEFANESVLLRWPAGPVQAAEAARVGQAQDTLLAEDKVNVVVFPDGCCGIDNTQTSGHAEMHDGRAASGAKQQVLGTPADTVDGLSREFLAEPCRYRPPQVGVAYDNPYHTFAGDVGCDAAAGGFDFGQFRHGVMIQAVWLVCAG